MVLNRLIRRLSKVVFKIDFFFIKKKIKYLGINSKIEGGYFCGVENLSIGRAVYIGPDAYINANGGVTIGDGTIIGPEFRVLSRNHDWKNSHVAPYDQGNINKAVFIGKGCWFGLGVKVAPGVNIGDGVIVGMGVTVTQDLASFSILKSPSQNALLRRDIEYIKKSIETEKYYMERD